MDLTTKDQQDGWNALERLLRIARQDTGQARRVANFLLEHEMAHVWQQSHGTPPRRSYHDRQWAAKMKEIGLQPSTTGEPGGKETGQSVTHYILPGGSYATAYAKLKAKGFSLRWQSAPAGQQAKAKKASKTKFTCSECAQNAWAKADALLICGNCYEDGEGDILLMVAEPADEAEAA